MTGALVRSGAIWAALALCACVRGQDASGNAVQGMDKAAQSVATSAPVLAARDVLLAIAVKARIAAADVDSTTSVSVSARDGIVTLSGTVRTPAEIARLRDAARTVAGVRSVRPVLRVDRTRSGAGQQAGNLALAATVMATIAAQTGLNAIGVHARAENGVVTIDGKARTAAIKATIADAARHVAGVRSLVDRVTIGS